MAKLAWTQVKKTNSINTMEHFRGNEAFVRRIYDLIDQVERRQKLIVTPFFTPLESQICEQLVGKQLLVYKSGGYEGAERCRFILMPYETSLDFKIVRLKATYAKQFTNINHRDVLGALMHLGIERETIGDIIVDDGNIFIYADEEIAMFITCSLTRIKHCNVHFTKLEEEIHHEVCLVEKNVIVSSLRLDVIVASLVHVSRTKAQNFIKAGLVKVNHVILEETSYLCNNNSVISIRGYGRFRFCEVVKMTKKDHYVITTGKYQ